MIHVSKFFIFLVFSYISMTSQAALEDIITDASSPPLIPCENDWFFYGNKCYKIFGKNDRLSWDDAAKSCADKKGQLATIQTQQLQDFLTYFLLYREMEDTWIGLNDRNSGSQYKWIDGSVVNYTYWDTGEPNGRNNFQEDCVEMGHWANAEFGMWSDSYCYNKRLYMCQSDKNEQFSNTDPRFCSLEKGGGFKLFDSCYHTVALKKSWYDAEKYCQDNFKGHLITILNSKVQSFMDYITLNFDKQFWIGIQIRDKTLQRWSSGWHAYFDRWNKRMENFKENSCGLRSYENLWTFAQCADEFPFICETHNTPPALKEAPKGWLCPNSSKDWKDLDGDTCYIFVTGTPRPWNDANYDCLTKGGALATIQSEEESKALHPYVIGTQDLLYVGLHRRLDNKNIFQWLDGSDLDYKNWYEGEPNYLNEECGVIWTDTMKWLDDKCHIARGYICSAKKVPTSLEGKKRQFIIDYMPCECPDCTGEKVGLGILIFITVISAVVGLALYIKKIPS